MAVQADRTRRPWARSLGGETLRAFAVFSVLLVILSAIAGQLLLRELSLEAVARRLRLGHDEATRIAEAVAALGRDREGIDFQLLGAKVDVLRSLILERLADRPFVLGVEVRDRFGAKLLQVNRSDLEPSAPGARRLQPGAGRAVTVHLMRGAVPEGQVRVAISDEQLPGEIRKLRNSLRLKLIAATVVAVGLLGVGFLYVLLLIRKNRQLEQSRLAAERRSYAGLLARELVHEIRNPLNAMKINLQMMAEELQEAPGPEREVYDLVASSLTEVRRLEELANNFNEFARPVEPKFEPRDLNRVLTAIASFLEVDFRHTGVKLEVDLEPLLPTVEIDEGQFRQAVMNLLVNARQVVGERSSGGGPGTVRLVSRAGAGGEAVVEIQDNGPGMAKEEHEKVFEVFYSKRKGGTGLGLPIARQIVERHGGAIEVQSAPGQGATFRIRLPRRHAQAAPVTS